MRCSASQFDPECVAAFSRLTDERLLELRVAKNGLGFDEKVVTLAPLTPDS